MESPDADPLNPFSEGLLVQLAFCFLLSPYRADPFVIAPLVALYALRESDRRAMMLFIAMSAAAVPLDLGFMFSGSGGFIIKLLAMGALALKAILTYAAVKAHDALPVARPDRTLLLDASKAEMQQRVQETVANALREELQKIAAPRPSSGSGDPPAAPGMVQVEGSSWDDV